MSRDALVVAAADALSWIENYPLNCYADYRAEWMAVADALRTALSDADARLVGEGRAD